MRLMTSILMAGFLVACGDKEAEDTAVEAEEEVTEEVEEETEAEDTAEEEDEDSGAEGEE